MLPLFVLHYVSILVYIVLVEDLRASAYSFNYTNVGIDDDTGGKVAVDLFSDTFD